VYDRQGGATTEQRTGVLSAEQLETATRFWWASLPRRAWRTSKLLGLALADGGYLAVWPRVAAFAPVAVFALGAAMGWLRPAAWTTFTYSVGLLALIVAISELGAGLGVWLCLGWAVGDFALFSHPLPGGGEGQLAAVLRGRVPLLISYVQLVTLLVLVPLASAQLRAQLTSRRPVGGVASQAASALGPDAARRETRWLPPALVQGALAAALTYSWALTESVLIRPVFTWREQPVPSEAVTTLVRYGWVLALMAAAAVVARFWLADTARARPELASRLRALSPEEAQLPASSPSRAPTGRPSQGPLRIVLAIPLQALAGTLLLAGLVPTVRDAVILGTMLVLIAIARGMLSRTPEWTRGVARIPVPARLAGAAFAGFVLTRVITGAWGNRSDPFLPIVWSLGASLLVTAALLADRGVAARRASTTAPTPTRAVSGPAMAAPR
jgi:hypothetical protein